MNLHEALVKLHTLKQNPDNWTTYGLCTSMLDLDPPDGVDYEFQKLMQRWPKHSGVMSFPISHPEDGEAFEAYEACLYSPRDVQVQYMWDRQKSAYAALRWELLEWMIEESKA